MREGKVSRAAGRHSGRFRNGIVGARSWCWPDVLTPVSPLARKDGTDEGYETVAEDFDSRLFVPVLSPGSQTGNPPWDIGAEVFVLKPVTTTQGRLFVDENKEIESRPHSNTVLKNA